MVADTLILVNGIELLHLNFCTPQQRTLYLIANAEAERWLSEGQCPEGRMGPKLHAVIGFIKNGGRRVVITTPELAAEALEPAADGTLRVGTTIVLSDSLAAANP